MKTPEKQPSAAPAAVLDLRREARIEVALPVVIEGAGRGVTKNVSASGVYVETDARITLGAPVNFTIEIDSAAGELLRMRCTASILRVEPVGSKQGIAAALQWQTH